MKQEKLLDALNYVNQEYIDDATPKTISRSNLRPWMALAACLALAVGIFAAARLAKPSAKPEPQASPEAAEEAPKADPGEPCYPEPNADAQTILDYRIGGLYLGMPQQDVLDLYGEPADRSEGGPMYLEDGSARESWWYKRSDDPEHLRDLQVQFADAGDGWVVNEIIVLNDCGLELPHGIRIGMTQEELLSVWPEIEAETELLDSGYEVDENDVTHPMIAYQQYARQLCFEVDLEDGVVYNVYLGRYYEDPPWDPDAACYPEPNADAQTILDYRLGELYLGMPQQDVLDVFGEPAVRFNGDPITLDDGSARDTWWYKRSGDMTHFCDFRLQFADTGDGWVVNEIKVYNSSGLELPRGIRTGMTNEELLSVWPELETAFSVERFDGPEDSGSGMYPIIDYSQNHRHLGFQIHLKANKIEAVSLGSYYEDPSFGMGVTLPEEPYDFSSGEITVWRRTDGGWQSVQRTERGAKCLETIFTIEELVPLDQAPGEIRYVVDFQNDTVCLVCAPEESVTAGPNTPPDAWGAVYHLEDRKALKASLKAGDAVPEGLRCLEQCVFPYGTWDTLGEAFE